MNIRLSMNSKKQTLMPWHHKDKTKPRHYALGVDLQPNRHQEVQHVDHHRNRREGSTPFGIEFDPVQVPLLKVCFSRGRPSWADEIRNRADEIRNGFTQDRKRVTGQ
jgi:hypothetical protein